MAEQQGPSIEAVQFTAPAPLPIDTIPVVDHGASSVDAPVLQDYEEPETTVSFYHAHGYYAKALKDGRNSGKSAYNTFFPRDSEAFYERASEVTAEELMTFFKKMNEQWTAANQFDQNIKLQKK